MNSFREKYQKRNDIKEDKDKDKRQSQFNKTKLNQSYYESKYTKPSSRKLVEQNIEKGKEFSRRRYDNKTSITEKNSRINILKTDNISQIGRTSNVNQTVRVIRQRKENNDYHLTKSTTDTSKVSNQGRGQQLISDVKPNQRKYGRTTVKETPKEENINYRHNNAYIKSSIKEEKNVKNDNEGSNALSQSFVVGRRNNEPEEKVSKKEVTDINAQNIPLPPRQLNNNITNNINNINNNFENNRIIIGEDKKSNFSPASLNIHSTIINNNKDNPSDINRIQSIFLLRQIFSYIEDKDFPYRLFFYSKLFKNKFGIRLDYYKNLYQHFRKKKFEDPYIDSPLFK